MNRDAIPFSWKQSTGQEKAHQGKLDGRQFEEVIDGERMDVAGRIQQGFGATRDQTDLQIECGMERNKD
jgi:uncharacterized protein YjbJ (UPF0337 family)